MRIITGDYIVKIYDNYGTRIKELDATTRSLRDAEELGLQLLTQSETTDGRYPSSYTIDRRLTNSLDPKAKW
jgi:hypothetical protein